MPKQIVLDLKKDPELFNTTAKEWAEAISRTKKTQVRNFYDRVLELKEDIKRDGFDNVYPFTMMLNSKVEYGVTRKVVSAEFQDMMSQCLEEIKRKKSEEVFNIFQLFFEAVLGFFKGRD